MSRKTYSRDALGHTSFYYCFDQQTLIHANTLDGIFKQCNMQPKPNRQAMYDFIHYGTIAPEQTMYEGIYRLPPGHYLDISDTNQIKVERYWDPANIKIDYTISFDDAVKKFRRLLTKSIKNAISKEEKTGCELSGGFDSSSIFCIASKIDDSITGLVMDFDHPSCNEQQYVHAVKSKCSNNIIHHNCGHLDYKNRYNMKFNYDLSPHWPIWITFSMYAPLLETIQKEGIKTVLTGQFGDHLLAGRAQNLLGYLTRGKLLTFLQEWYMMPHKYAWMKRLLRRIADDKLSKSQKNFIKKILRRSIDSPHSKHIPSYLNYSSTRTFASPFQKQRVDAMTNPLQIMFADSNFNKAVEEKYGIKYIHPYGEKEIVEFLLSLPPEFFYSHGNFRHFHAEAMKDILPQEVLKRRNKGEFSIILNQQIAAIDRKSLWQNPNIVNLNIVKKELILKYEAMFITNRLKGYDRHQYWRMINLEYWYRYNTFLDKS